MPMFHNTGQGWRGLERWPYLNEEELERLMLDIEDLIPGERADTWTVWARQMISHAANQLDLVGLGSDGSVTIVECKLGRNREERREVVAQVLEYAAGLWEMRLDRFCEVFRRRHPSARDPFELLAEQAPPEASEAGWDVLQARQVCAENLEHGRFRLIVAVDDLSDRLRRIVDYVNNRSRGELKLVAMEIPRYGGPGATVVAPVMYGDRAPSPTSRSAQQVYPSIDELIATAAPELIPLIGGLHEYLAAGAADRLTPRTSRASISYDARIDGSLRNVLQLYPRGGPGGEQPAAVLFVESRAMAALGSTIEHLLESATHRGFKTRGRSILLRTADLARLDELEHVLEAEVLDLIDA